MIQKFSSHPENTQMHVQMSSIIRNFIVQMLKIQYIPLFLQQSLSSVGDKQIS